MNLESFPMADVCQKDICDFVIPFINVNVSDAKSFYRAYYSRLEAQDEKFKNKLELDLDSRSDDWFVSYQSLLKNMLLIALKVYQGKKSELTKEILALVPLIEKKVALAATVAKVASWGSGDYIYVSSWFSSNSILERENNRVIRSIAELFQFEVGKTGIGYRIVGLCSNCGKIFEKKRKDQEYCSKGCGSTVRSRRAYERGKL